MDRYIPYVHKIKEVLFLLQNLNQFIQRYMPIFPLLCIVTGVVFDEISSKLIILIPFIFAFMTFASSLNMRFRDVGVFKKYPKTILFTIAFLHIIMPVWAYFLSELLFDDPLLTVGFVISVAVPTGVTSLIWVAMCRGNIPLSLAIILIDTLLAPVMLPLLVHIVAGQTIEIDTVSIMIDLLWMIVVPSIVAIFVNEWGNQAFNMKLKANLPLFSKLALFSIITINSSVIAPFVKDFSVELLGVVALVLVLALSGYALAFLVAHYTWRDKETKISFIFNAGMRNIAVGVVIATSYFPPTVAMPVVFGMLFQQVLASFFAKIVVKW